MVKNPPVNAGDMGSSPDPGGSHMPCSNSLCATTTEPVLESAGATTTEAPGPWALCSAMREATPRRSWSAATREWLPLSTTRAKPMKQQRPSTAPPPKKNNGMRAAWDLPGGPVKTVPSKEGVQVQSLVGEPRSHMSRDAAKKIKKEKTKTV